MFHCGSNGRAPRARRRRRRAGAPTRPFAEAFERRRLLAFAPIGQEFLVNSATAGSQSAPSVAVDADGDVVVAFSGPSQYAFGGTDVLVRHFSASGAPVGDETRIVPVPIALMPGVSRVVHSPQVAVDADGDYVVVWIDAGGKLDFEFTVGSFVYAQCFTSTGTPRGNPFLVNGAHGLTPVAPSVAMDRDGDFVIAWYEVGRADQVNVFARGYGPTGTPKGGEFTVNGPALEFDHGNPSVAMDAAGNFAVAWQRQFVERDPNDGTIRGRGPHDIYVRGYDVAGGALGDGILVNVTTEGEQVAPSVAASADGDFVVAWHGPRGAGPTGVFARRFVRGDESPPTEILVSDSPAAIGFPQVATDADGNFAVAWHSPGEDGSGLGVYARRFDAAGVRLGTEFRVNTQTTGDQTAVSLTSDLDGDLVAMWHSPNQDGSGLGVYGQRYDESTDTVAPFVTDVFVAGGAVRPGQEVSPDSRIVVRFSERLSTAGGAAGANSAVNPAHWRLERGGVDVSSNIQSITFGHNAGQYEATLHLSAPMPPGDYVLVADDALRDLAANELDGNEDGIAGGVWGRFFIVINQPPATVGIPFVTVAEDEDDAVIDLFDAFSDSSDADAALTFAAGGITNPFLFGSTAINGRSLTLDFAPDANGTSAVTVRATDTGGLFVEATFLVTVLAVNDAPVNSVPGQQFGTPGQPLVFSTRGGNAISVSDIDGGPVEVTLQTGPGYTATPARTDGVVVTTEPQVLRLSGPIANVNAALDGLRLEGDSRADPRTSLIVTTTDTAAGIGGPLGDADTILITFDARLTGLSVGDVRVTEGNAGTTAATFTVRRSGAAAEVSVAYATSDGTAREGSDYQPASGRISFARDETERTVTVLVTGELRFELDETFTVMLSDPVGAVITDELGAATIVNDDGPEPPPTVTQVFVSGTTWTAAFKAYLAAQGLGDATHGYAVPAGAAQLAVLPWGNINQVSVRFSRDVLALDLDLAVRGVNVLNYPVTGFAYDGVDAATWTLGRAVRNDKLVLDLDGGADGVVDDAGVLLDGNWSNGTDAYPSGDGAAGGDLRFRLNAVAGDVTRNGRVDANDWMQLRMRQRRSTTTPGAGSTAYTVFHDPDGSGVIDTYDMLHARRNLLRSLPGAEPAGSVGGAALPASVAGASITREVFSRRCVLA